MKEDREKVFYRILRETSKYNKYMKWHVNFYHDDMKPLSSEWFKTQKEARQSIDHAIWRGERGFPIGDHISYTKYEELTD